MKSRRISVWVSSLLVFLSITVTCVWYFGNSGVNKPKEITFEEALNRIESKEIKEVTIRANSLELQDKASDKYATSLDTSDAPREAILRASDTSGAKVIFEPVSSGWDWLILLNAVPFLISICSLIITIALTVYVVRTLSRNKG